MNNSYTVVALKGSLVSEGGQTPENAEVTVISLVIYSFIVWWNNIYKALIVCKIP